MGRDEAMCTAGTLSPVLQHPSVTGPTYGLRSDIHGMSCQ